MMKDSGIIASHFGGFGKFLRRAGLVFFLISTVSILASYSFLPQLPTSSPKEFWSKKQSTVVSLDGRSEVVAIESSVPAAESHQSALQKLHKGRKMHLFNASVLDMTSWESRTFSDTQDRSTLKDLFGIKQPAHFNFFNLSDEVLSKLGSGYVSNLQESYAQAGHRKLLIIDVQHGLGNRLRALASSVALASSSGRHLRLLWVPDVHCGARFQDLFDAPDLDVWDTFDVREIAGPEFARYNYMENEDGSKKDEAVITKSDKHIYVRSAYRLRSDGRVLTEDLHEALRSLQPSKEVTRYIISVEKEVRRMQLKKLALSQRSESSSGLYIGVHIRSNQPDAEPGFQLPESAYSAQDWATSRRMRSLASVDVFVAEITRLLQTDPHLLIFLAADHPDTYGKIQAAFGTSRVTWLEKHGCLDRRPKCQQLALADMYILSKSSQILGSTWSSFTEVAALLTTRVLVRTAGRDFFLAPPPRHAPLLCSPDSMDHPARFHGTSLFTAVMGRKDALERVLPSWLRVRGLDEIVIVDWGCQPPLRPLIDWFQDGRIKLIEVPEESLWVLSRATNLAARHSAGNRLLKVDSDTFLEEDLLEAHPLTETERAFWAGNWKTARDENEKHLNGVVLLPRREWITVNGYDECVISYGWEDEDLYRRLGMHGNIRKTFDLSKLRHLAHSDAQRIARQRLMEEGLAPPWQSHMNIIMIKILSGMLTPWDQLAEGTRYNCSQQAPMTCTCAIYSVPPPLEDLIPPHRLLSAHLGALGGELRSVTGSAFDAPTLSVVKSEDWFSRQLELHWPATSRRPVIVAQLLGCCMARLEALVLARRLALHWTRPLIVVWQSHERDECSKSFWDLFTPRGVIWQTASSWQSADSEEQPEDVGEGTDGSESATQGASFLQDEVQYGKFAEYSLRGVHVEVTEEFFEWEITDGLYDVIDSVTDPKVGLPDVAPGEKHVFLRLGLSKGSLEPKVAQELQICGPPLVTDMAVGKQEYEGANPNVTEVGSRPVSELLEELGLDMTGGEQASHFSKGSLAFGWGKWREAKARDENDVQAIGLCKDPGALLVRLGGDPIDRLLALHSAHTFAAALGRRLVAWWPVNEASLRLPFESLFASVDDVEVREGAGPILSDGGFKDRMNPGRPSRGEVESAVEQGMAGSPSKTHLLSKLLHRLHARNDPSVHGSSKSSDVSTDGQENDMLDDQEEAAFVHTAEQAISELGEGMEDPKQMQDEGRLGLGAGSQAAGAGEEASISVESQEVLEQAQPLNAGPITLGVSIAAAEAEAAKLDAKSSGNQRLTKIEAIGVLDLDKTGNSLPVVTLTGGGSAWYAWEPPTWNVGVPVVTLKEAVGSHLFLSLSGPNFALGDYFSTLGKPGWSHHALTPSLEIAEVLDGLEQKLRGVKGANSKGAKGGKGPLLLFVNEGSLGGCASLNAALDRMLVVLMYQNAQTTKVDLLNQLIIVESRENRSAHSTSRSSETDMPGIEASKPESELGVDGADNQVNRELGTCMEARQLANNLSQSTHSKSGQPEPLCFKMPKCPTFDAPATVSASEQDTVRTPDPRQVEGRKGSKEAELEKSRRTCLVEELATVSLLSKIAKRVFSFENVPELDLIVAWGPGSKHHHKIVCPAA